jgi:multiple sugar transport system ATP-binding protein
MIYVTHDQVEAMTMADKIVVLDLGTVAQVGSPLELYNKPNGLFVAGFIGSPTMNLIKGAPAAKRGATRSASARSTPTFRRRGRMAGQGAPRRAPRLRHLRLCEVDGIGPLTLRLEGEAPLQAGARPFS